MFITLPCPKVGGFSKVSGYHPKPSLPSLSLPTQEAVSILLVELLNCRTSGLLNSSISVNHLARFV